VYGRELVDMVWASIDIIIYYNAPEFQFLFFFFNKGLTTHFSFSLVVGMLQAGEQ